MTILPGPPRATASAAVARYWPLLAAAIVVAQAATLLAWGQPAICACGTVKLWHGVVLSAENSQHITDWYTFSHVIHGIAFYFGLRLVAPRLPVGLAFVAAVGLEVAWELVENTPFIIDRYRESALAQGYSGDSVVNSVSDTLAMALGFLLALRLPVWLLLALVVGFELFTAVMIRDGLILNIIQLVYPNDLVSNWQAGR